MKHTDDADGRLAMELIATAHSIEARLEAALEPLGLSLAKFGLLARLAEAGEPLPLSALADRLACVRSNITQLVDRLEADRLVRRIDDSQDRRSIRALLTDEGRSRHAAGVDALRAAQRELFADLPAAERESLGALARTLKGEGSCGA
jgi:DNA-binding MarR family transcriptional regulator